MHLIRSRAQILTRYMEAEYFGVRARREESSGKHRSLDHRARDRLQRIARLRAQCGRTLKAHETEQRQYQAEAESAAGHATEMELIAVQVPAVTNQHQRH